MSVLFRHIIVASSLFLVSCGERNNSNKDSRTLSAVDTSNHSVTQDLYSTQNNLQVVKNFANDFQPDSFPYKGIGELGKIPDSVIYAFKALRHSDSVSQKRYLTVIFLKLYLDHLRCCHQSYEVRKKLNNSIDSVTDPLVYEYNLATRLFDTNKPIEFISSGIADTYVEENRYLAEYPEIKELLNKIKPVKDSIEKHLYW